MPIIVETSENPSLSVTVVNEKGERIIAAYVSCSIRAGRGVSINVDVQNPTACNASEPEISEQVMAFVRGCFFTARNTGIPVAASFPTP